MQKSILDCGHTPSEHSEISNGYGQDDQGRTYCYEDCAIKDLEFMRDNGRITLYVTQDEKGIYFVSNWPGSLKIRCTYGEKKRNSGGFGSQRTDVWFNFDGSQWHGVNRGNSQLTSCRRKKTNAPNYGTKDEVTHLIAHLRQVATDRTQRDTLAAIGSKHESKN